MNGERAPKQRHRLAGLAALHELETVVAQRLREIDGGRRTKQFLEGDGASKLSFGLREAAEVLVHVAEDAERARNFDLGAGRAFATARAWRNSVSAGRSCPDACSSVASCAFVGGDLRSVGAEQAALRAQRLLEQGARLLVEIELAIDAADDAHHLGRHLRLSGELLLDTLGAAVDDVAGGELDSASPVEVGELEEAGEKSGDLSCLLALEPRAVALHGEAIGVEADKCREQGHDEAARGKPEAMADRELAQAVEAGLGARRYRPCLEKAFEVLAQGGRRRVAPLDLAMQRRRDDRVEIAFQPPRPTFLIVGAGDRQALRRSFGETAHPAARPLDLLAGHRRREAGRRVARAPVRQLAAEQLEQHHPEGIDVGRGARRLAENLLGGGVVGRQRPEALHCRLTAGPLGRQDLGDAEVEEDRLAVAADQDVGRLDVAVDHEMLVGSLDRTAAGCQQSQSLVDAEVALGGVAGDRHAVDLLEHEVGPTFRGIPPSSRRAMPGWFSPARIWRS